MKMRLSVSRDYMLQVHCAHMQHHHGHSLHHRERIPPRLLLRRAATCEPWASSLTRKARLDLHT
eukprot:COSAG01_NODE_23106_length_828_cov_0.986283_1_plen_63_part_10